jgi:hypothetical protein
MKTQHAISPKRQPPTPKTPLTDRPWPPTALLTLSSSSMRRPARAKDLNVHFIATARANINAAFDFAQQLMAVTSPSEFFELSAAHARKQFEMLNEQIKQLSALVQKAATESAQPLQAGAMKAFDKVA